jgi:hypothetical protein
VGLGHAGRPQFVREEEGHPVSLESIKGVRWDVR